IALIVTSRRPEMEEATFLILRHRRYSGHRCYSEHRMLKPRSVRRAMHFKGSSEWRRRVCIALMALVFASPALAEKGKLRDRLTPAVMAVVYPGAERLGVEEGSPPAIAVYQGDKIAAYVFSTLDIIAAPGYTSTPFDVIAGIDLSGRITGAKVLFHNEPHIVGDASRQRELDTFLARQAGSALRGGTDPLPPDYVADTT